MAATAFQPESFDSFDTGGVATDEGMEAESWKQTEAPKPLTKSRKRVLTKTTTFRRGEDVVGEISVTPVPQDVPEIEAEIVEPKIESEMQDVSTAYQTAPESLQEKYDRERELLQGHAKALSLLTEEKAEEINRLRNPVKFTDKRSSSKGTNVASADKETRERKIEEESALHANLGRMAKGAKVFADRMYSGTYEDYTKNLAEYNNEINQAKNLDDLDRVGEKWGGYKVDTEGTSSGSGIFMDAEVLMKSAFLNRNKEGSEKPYSFKSREESLDFVNKRIGNPILRNKLIEIIENRHGNPTDMNVSWEAAEREYNPQNAITQEFTVPQDLRMAKTEESRLQFELEKLKEVNASLSQEKEDLETANTVLNSGLYKRSPKLFALIPGNKRKVEILNKVVGDRNTGNYWLAAKMRLAGLETNFNKRWQANAEMVNDKIQDLTEAKQKLRVVADKYK